MRTRRPLLSGAAALVALLAVMVAVLFTACSKGTAEHAATAGPIASRPPSFRGTGGPSSSVAAGEDISPLVAGAVDNQCLLSAQDFAALVGREANPRPNTATPGSGARSPDCFYLPSGASTPAGRIDVYGSNGPPPLELVARLIGKVAGSRPLAGVARAAVVIPEGHGLPGTDLWVATDRDVVQIHLFYDKPDDAHWRAAGAAAVRNLPS